MAPNSTNYKLFKQNLNDMFLREKALLLELKFKSQRNNALRKCKTIIKKESKSAKNTQNSIERDQSTNNLQTKRDTAAEQ